MPSTESVYRLFLASPSDVSAERARASEVVDHLNHIWRSRGVQLRLLRWETDTYPAAGDDGQDVINGEIPDDFEIFVGIMWTRFGTPTARAESGTEEEFQRALARRAQSDSPEILFYFRVGPLPIGDIDGQQLAKVQEFKHDMPRLGILYFDYDSPDDLRNYLLVHLNNVIEDLQGRAGGAVRSAGLAPATPEAETQLQLQRLRAEIAKIHTGIFEEREQFSAIFVTIAQFDVDYQSLGASILDPEFPQGEEREAKLLAAASEAVLRLAVNLEERIPKLVSIQARNLDLLSGLLVSARRYPQISPQVAIYVKNADDFYQSNKGFYASAAGTRDLIDSLPPANAEVAVAKRRCQDAFTSLDRQLELVAQLASALSPTNGSIAERAAIDLSER